jgi:hypothetical protein
MESLNPLALDEGGLIIFQIQHPTLG